VKLVVGLGNPGRRYAATRHNVGWRVLEVVARRVGISLAQERYGGRFGVGSLAGQRVGLLQPCTWMNASGRAVAEAREGLEIHDPTKLLVVSDDLDLPLGRLRLRSGGGAGGHRGLAHVIACLGTAQIPRLRVGIGRPPPGTEAVEWVLQDFSEDERPCLEVALSRAADALACFIAEGIEAAMDRFNAAPPAPSTASTAGATQGSGGRSAWTLQSERKIADPADAMAEPIRPIQNNPPGSGLQPVRSTPQPQMPRSPRLADRLARPFVRFMETEISSALVLLAMAVVALVWANSPFRDSYHAFWNTPLAISVGSLFEINLPLELWVNDGLMTIFFFAVGMEIKREMVSGDLSTRARAMLPVLGALGGMVAPACIYTWIQAGGPASHGWGIPMATDIAFAVAAMSVLGSRVPPPLRVFLLALAIADDLGAVAVIAVFYTAELHLTALAWAGAGLALCAVLNWVGVRNLLVYLVVGAFVWFETHHSGIHATIAGVMLGFLTPTTVPADHHDRLIDSARSAVDRLVEVLRHGVAADQGGHARHYAVRSLRQIGTLSLSPLDYLTNGLERWVAFVIMPLFALANAGVALDPDMLRDPVAEKVMLGVALGLLIGKPVGITAFSWIAVKLRVAELPRGVSWTAIMATGVLAGIGFTVALFVTALAFDHPVFTAGAKVGILLGSIIATVLGLLLLNRALPRAPASAGDAS